MLVRKRSRPARVGLPSRSRAQVRGMPCSSQQRKSEVPNCHRSWCRSRCRLPRKRRHCQQRRSRRWIMLPLETVLLLLPYRCSKARSAACRLQAVRPTRCFRRFRRLLWDRTGMFQESRTAREPGMILFLFQRTEAPGRLLRLRLRVHRRRERRVLEPRRERRVLEPRRERRVLEPRREARVRPLRPRASNNATGRR